MDKYTFNEPVQNSQTKTPVRQKRTKLKFTKNVKKIVK